MSNRQSLLKGLLFIGYSIVILYLIFSGKMSKYINPKMNYYLIIASIIFFAMGLNYIKDTFKRKHQISLSFTRKYLIYFIPLIIMFLLQPLSLNSSLAKNKGFSMTKNQANAIMKSIDTIDNEKKSGGDNDKSNSNNSTDKADEDRSSDKNDLNEKGNYIIYYEGQWVNIESLDNIIVTEENYMKVMEALFMEPHMLKNKSIEITGFVLRNDDFADNHFVVARGLITCCLADSAIVGVMATGDNFDQHEDNQWICVKGKLDVHEYNGQINPIIIAEEVIKTPVPEQEYIYP